MDLTTSEQLIVTEAKGISKKSTATQMMERMGLRRRTSRSRREKESGSASATPTSGKVVAIQDSNQAIIQKYALEYQTTQLGG